MTAIREQPPQRTAAPTPIGIAATLIKRGPRSVRGNLLGGITVNENAIVGAGSVYKDVPAHATVRRQPARLLQRVKN